MERGKSEPRFIYPSRDEVQKLSQVLAGDRAGKFWVFMDWPSILTDFYRLIIAIDDPEQLAVKLGRFLAIIPSHIRNKIEKRAAEYEEQMIRSRSNVFTDDIEEEEGGNNEIFSVFDDEEDCMQTIETLKLTEIEFKNQVMIRAITDIFYELNLIPQEIKPPTIDYTDFRKIFSEEAEEEIEEFE